MKGEQGGGCVCESAVSQGSMGLSHQTSLLGNSDLQVTSPGATWRLQGLGMGQESRTSQMGSTGLVWLSELPQVERWALLKEWDVQGASRGAFQQLIPAGKPRRAFPSGCLSFLLCMHVLGANLCLQGCGGVTRRLGGDGPLKGVPAGWLLTETLQGEWGGFGCLSGLVAGCVCVIR